MIPLRDAESYAREMFARLPRGALWPERFTGVWSKFLLAIGCEFGRLRQEVLHLIAELDPRTTSDMLTDWEQAYGLPDQCVAPPTTDAERTRRLLTLVTMKGNLRKHFIEGIAYDIGVDVLLEEFAPATMGVSRCGDRMDGHGWRWAIFCHAPSTIVTRAYCGSSGCGDRLSDFGNAGLECVMRKHIPVPSKNKIIFGYNDPQSTFGAAALWEQPGPASGVDTVLPARVAGATYFMVGTFAAEAFGGSDAAFGLIASATRVAIGTTAGGSAPRVSLPIVPAGRSILTVIQDDSSGARTITVRLNGALVGTVSAAGAGTIAGDAIAFTTTGLDHFGLKLWPLHHDEVDWLERVLARQFEIKLADWPVNLGEE